MVVVEKEARRERAGGKARQHPPRAEKRAVPQRRAASSTAPSRDLALVNTLLSAGAAVLYRSLSFLRLLL
jgi:hypothetical protein